LEKLIITMADSKRPNHISVSKSVNGRDWAAFAYKVSIETECLAYFGVKLSSLPTDGDDYVCSSYGQSMANRNEQVAYLS